MSVPRIDLSAPQRRRAPAEAAVPMINVVFLLLIFFLISAQLVPPDPVPLQLPNAEATAEAARDSATLVLDGGGTLYLGGEAVDLSRLADRIGGRDPDGPDLTIRADAGAQAGRLAEVLSALGQAGVSRAQILVVRP